MRKNERAQENLCFICHLGLERCRQKLAHLMAMINVTEVCQADAILTNAIVGVIASIERELATHSEWLEKYGQ